MEIIIYCPDCYYVCLYECGPNPHYYVYIATEDSYLRIRCMPTVTMFKGKYIPNLPVSTVIEYKERSEDVRSRWKKYKKEYYFHLSLSKFHITDCRFIF